MPTEFVEVPADLECILLVAALASLVIFAHHIEVRISTRMTLCEHGRALFEGGPAKSHLAAQDWHKLRFGQHAVLGWLFSL